MPVAAQTRFYHPALAGAPPEEGNWYYPALAGAPPEDAYRT